MLLFDPVYTCPETRSVCEYMNHLTSTVFIVEPLNLRSSHFGKPQMDKNVCPACLAQWSMLHGNLGDGIQRASSTPYHSLQ